MHCATINIPGTHFCYRLSQRKWYSAAGGIMSIENSSEYVIKIMFYLTIGYSRYCRYIFLAKQCL